MVAGIIGVLIEGETRLARTGGIGGLSGSDVVFSGPADLSRVYLCYLTPLDQIHSKHFI